MIWRRERRLVKANILWLCLVVATISKPGSLGASPTILLDDDFNAENGGVGVINYDNFANWKVLDGSVDLLGPGLVDYLPGNGIYLDLDGTTSDAATLQSRETFNFEAGDEVTLAFDLAGPCQSTLPECGSFPGLNDGVNEVRVSMGDLLDATFLKSFDEPLERVTRVISVVEAASVEVRFVHNGGDNIGLILDNFQLTLVRIPEPSSLPAAATLACIAGSRRRRRG